uniref:Uncharacterized protein n=1 Tax=Salinispora arenicola (strain CNS-205) TaxID=391037 RepID=A8M6X3_SALAI
MFQYEAEKRNNAGALGPRSPALFSASSCSLEGQSRWWILEPVANEISGFARRATIEAKFPAVA